MSTSVPAIVLGGSGYVAGELLRLLVGHPQLHVTGVMSESRAGKPIRETFPNLQNSLGGLEFSDRTRTLELIEGGRLALFSAAPHGASAALVAEFISRAEKVGSEMTVVDVSADFRFADADAYAAVYHQPHDATKLLDRFVSAVPEHLASSEQPHVGHPGCFATALLMAAVPLMKLGIAEQHLAAIGITGSTGSGRTPAIGTHHPERHANLFAYKPLAHRHSPEVESICEGLTGHRPLLHFIPHSGPFSRGIHVTMQATLKPSWNAESIRNALEEFYSASPFVIVKDGMPRIKDVVGSNFCHIGVAADGQTVAVMVVIDNLVKGAAGGAVQWMNRKLGFEETEGLMAPAVGWI